MNHVMTLDSELPEMRSKSVALCVLILALSAQDISAQQATAGQADEQAVTKTEDAAEAGAVTPQKAETRETQQPPAQFIPRETISPDSVIAFPADI